MPRASHRPSCTALRKDGRPCTAPAAKDGLCVGHQPEASAARSKGGRNSAKAARLSKLIPPRLIPVFDRLEEALTQVHEGELDPRVATAMASLAGAMVRVLTAGELEERVRVLEDRGQLTPDVGHRDGHTVKATVG